MMIIKQATEVRISTLIRNINRILFLVVYSNILEGNGAAVIKDSAGVPL